MFFLFFLFFCWNRFKGRVDPLKKSSNKNYAPNPTKLRNLRSWFYVGFKEPHLYNQLISSVAVLLNNFRDHIINIHKPSWIFSRLPNRSPIATAWAFGALATLALQGELLSLGVDGWLSSLISAPPDILAKLCKNGILWWFGCTLFSSHPQFFSTWWSKDWVLFSVWRPNHPINRCLKQQQYQQSHGCNNRLERWDYFLGCRLLHGTPVPNRHTHTSGSFESRGAAWEEGTVNGEWDEFFFRVSIAKMVSKFLRNSGCGMIWKLTQKINVSVYISFSFVLLFLILVNFKKNVASFFFWFLRNKTFTPTKNRHIFCFKNKQTKQRRRVTFVTGVSDPTAVHQEPHVERTLDPATHQVAEWWGNLGWPTCWYPMSFHYPGVCHKDGTHFRNLESFRHQQNGTVDGLIRWFW